MEYIDIFREIANKTLPIFKSYRKDIKNLEIEIKKDKTLLTKADIEIQGIIVETIKRYDINANFIAEEKDLRIVNRSNKIIWVIDPIDGTRPFTEHDNYEYCCAIGVLENGIPIASMIFMPEMGKNETPILAIASLKTREIFVNGLSYDYSNRNEKYNFASTTREFGSLPSKIEEHLVKLGIEVKNRTTSQSIDLLRTAIDISPYSSVGVGHFTLFYRENQKIWDGIPGICFNSIVGKKTVDLNGNELVPFSYSFLNLNEPVSPSIIVAYSNEIKNALKYFHS